MKYPDDFIDKIICGDCLEVIKDIPDNCVDAVVTDPPYGLKFMGKKWDYDVPKIELWKEVFRVLKPGGHLLSFFGTRTYHRGVVNIEDAGFEIRDMLQWLYGSGFPKSYNIAKGIESLLEFASCNWSDWNKLDGEVIEEKLGYWKLQHNHGYRNKDYTDVKRRIGNVNYKHDEAKKWNGWGTALKPACEPIVLARKPISEKNIAQNVLKWGTGGLNIDGCRIGLVGIENHKTPANSGLGKKGIYGDSTKKIEVKDLVRYDSKGRFPANVILDDEVARMLDKQSGISKSNFSPPNSEPSSANGCIYGWAKYPKLYKSGLHYADSGGASRFFYVTKADRNERWSYCHFCDKPIRFIHADNHIHDAIQKYGEKDKYHYLEFHPTIKPLDLIKYLVKLITPKDGIVLDPFIGTGTTAVACRMQCYHYIGIDNNKIYCKIARKRLSKFPKRLDIFH